MIIRSDAFLYKLSHPLRAISTLVFFLLTATGVSLQAQLLDSTGTVPSGDSLAAGVVVADSLADEPLTYRRLDREIRNNAFRGGEKLTFKIRYGIISAGEATMEVIGKTVLEDSIPVYHIMTTARSNGTFDIFYKVRDTVQTFMDTKGLFSRRFYKQLREGSYKYDLLVDYRQNYGTASVNRIRYHNDEPLRIKNEDNFKLKIPPYVLDVLGSFYFIRTQELGVGEPFYISNHDNKKIYDLQIIVQKRERVKVKAGEFNTIKIQPRLSGEAIFKQEGELWVWVTDDEYKIPVQMKSKILVGSITTELIDIQGIPLPLKSQVK